MTVLQVMKLLITFGAQRELPIINIGSTHSLSLHETAKYVLQQTGTSVKNSRSRRTKR